MIDTKDNIPYFSDLFLPSDNPLSGHMFPGPEPIPEGMSEFINTLVEKSKQINKIDFLINHEGIFFRGNRMPTISGNLYIYRRMPKEAWPLDKCGFPSNIKDYVLSERLSKGGLVIVSGMPGNGKSTTCASIIIERLKAYGGLCITVEDPPEMPMQGMHGKGLCFQREVDNGEEFHIAVRDAMRGYPSRVNTMMLIGEVRDAETASLALRSSVDGRLVFITTHAGNVIQALQRIISLASKNIGADEARALLGSGIRFVAHQTIKENKLELETLFDTQQVSAIIKNTGTSIDNLQNEINQQKNKSRMGLPIEVRNLSS